MKKNFALLLIVITLFSLVSCSGKLEWPNGRLGSMIPQIEGAKGDVLHNDIDSLSIRLEDINENQYYEYIEACKTKGFSIEITEEGGSFTAFTENGYKIDISYYSYGDMQIKVNAPISMDTFEWPKSDIAKLLPKPNSDYGKISWEADYGFVIYVGNTTKSDYQNYINAVRDCGFTIDYEKGENFYYADNSDGYSVSIKYEGFNTMFVRIDDPDDESSTDSNNSSNNSPSEDTSNDKNESNNNEDTDTSEDNNDSEKPDNTETTNITPDNNLDFKNLLNLLDPMDASVAVFASNYAGQTVEFNGCIHAINNHGNYDTRYDILIGAGNYNEDSSRGPNFRLTNVGAFDMDLNTLWVEDVLYVGVNVHIVAKVGNYNPNSTLFELDIISVTVN